MKPFRTLKLLSLGFIPFFAGCLGAQGEDISLRLTQLEDQTRTLSNQMDALHPADTWSDLQTLKGEVSVLKNTMGEMGGANPAQELQRLQAEINRLQSAVRQAHAQLGLDLAPLDQPLALSSPASSYSSPSSAAEMTGIKSGETVTVMVNGVPHQMKVNGAALGSGNSPKAPNEASTVSPASPASAGTVPGMQPASDQKPENALYEASSKAFSERRYKDALDGWKQFTDLYPKHTLTPNAYFWQGESSFQLQDYPRAAVAYQQVIEKFPRSAKYPAALLKQGMSFLRSGKTEAGKVRLEELIAKHPKSSEAERAKKILAGLK